MTVTKTNWSVVRMLNIVSQILINHTVLYAKGIFLCADCYITLYIYICYIGLLEGKSPDDIGHEISLKSGSGLLHVSSTHFTL